MRPKSDKCSRCRTAFRASNCRYCAPCKAAYMREWRKTNPLNEEQKTRHNVRSYTAMYVKRGKLFRKPCEVCGEVKVEAHHDDYTKPLEVRWLCRMHHLQHHGKMLEAKIGDTIYGKDLQQL